MMRKDFVRSIGYFDEKLPYTHDYELWLRTLLSRVDFHYINEPLTAYRRHSNMGTVQNLEAVQTEFEFVRRGYYSQLQSLLNAL
jgi:hypothetical protein